MRKRISDHFISALIGGVVGAVVVLVVTGQKPAIPSLGETVYAQAERPDMPTTPNGKFRTLEVENLIITERATLLDKEGRQEVIIQDGSVIAEKAILGQKLVGQQIQGHAVVVNRMYATPDNLVATRMEQWRFYAEIGASLDTGGEIVLRSIAGHSMVGKPTNEGVVFRMGYNPEQQPQMLAIQNSDRTMIPISFELSEEQKRMLNMVVPQN